MITAFESYKKTKCFFQDPGDYFDMNDFAHETFLKSIDGIEFTELKAASNKLLRSDL